MKVTRLKPQRRNSRRYSVFLDGTYSFSLDQETIIALGLKPGIDLEPADVEHITHEEKLRRAKDYALLLLSYRARTVKELCDRLKRKKFEPDIIDAAINRLKELKLLDDNKFARDYVEDRIKLRHKGKWVVRGELLKLGISKEQIEQALAQAPDELEPAQELVHKYRSRHAGLEPEVRKRRLYALLARRGFSPDTIREALKLPENRT